MDNPLYLARKRKNAARNANGEGDGAGESSGCGASGEAARENKESAEEISVPDAEQLFHDLRK